MNKLGLLFSGVLLGTGLGFGIARLTEQRRPEGFQRHMFPKAAEAEPKAVLAAPEGATAAAPTIPVTEQTRTRLSVLASLGGPDWQGFHCAPLRAFFNPGPRLITDEFAQVFGLSGPERARLEAAMEQARLGIESMQRSVMQHEFDSANGVLSVTIPSTAANSGPVYDAALAAMREVLGPERYSYFEKFSADSFDSAFSQFGASTLRYTIRAAQPDAGAMPEGGYFQVDERVESPGGGFSTCNSRISLAHLRKMYPLAGALVERYLPKKP